MDKNISIVGINGDFFGNEFGQSINKVDENLNKKLNSFGKKQVNDASELYGFFLRNPFGQDNINLLSATVDLELEFWLQKYKNENDNKKEMSVSCLLEVLMWNIIYKNFNQLNDENHKMVLSRLNKNFKRIIKKLRNGSHELNFEEIVKSGDFVEKILDYSMTEIFAGIDIQNKSEYVKEIKNEIQAVPQFFSKETEKYKKWVKNCKDCHWNSNTNHPSYLFITNSSSKSTDENFNCLVWNNNYQNVLSCKENFVEQEDIHTEINPEENNMLDLNNEQYDEYISSGGKNGFFHHIGFPLDKTLAMCKNSFANLLLLSYLVEEKYSGISKDSENKFYQKKRSYLEIIFKKACKSKYDNKSIQDGFMEFKKILSDRKIILDKYKLNKIMDSYFSNRQLPMIVDEDSYTNNYILGNLERFFNINNGKAEFKNDSCKIEFGKLKIRKGTSWKKFSSHPIDKHVSMKEIEKLVQITNFIPTSELLKMNFDDELVSIYFGNFSNTRTDYISKHIIKLERINDLNDKSFIDGVGDCKEIVEKIFKYATIGENKNSNLSFEEINKLIESKKIILNAENHNVIKALFSCVDDKFGKRQAFELIKSLYSTCSKSNEEIKFVNELIDDFCKFNQIANGLVPNNFHKNNSNLTENHVEFIAKIKMECGEKDLAKCLIKYYAKTNLLDIYFEKGKDDIKAEELAADFFEFKYFDQIINSDRLYFFKRAKEICLQLQEANKNEQLEKFKEFLCSSAFGRTDYFGELLNNIDKDLFLSLDLISEMFYLDETLEYSHHDEREEGEKKEIYDTKYSYRYDFDKRKKFLELVIQNFPDDADIYKKIFANMIDAHAKKRLECEEFDSLFLAIDNVACLKQLMQAAMSYNAKEKLNFSYQVAIYIIDLIVKNKSTDDKELYNLFLNFISKEHINFVFPNKDKLEKNPFYKKNPSEQIFWSDDYIRLVENILITYVKSMKNFMNDIIFETIKILFDKCENINIDFVKTLLNFDYVYEPNKYANRKMSKQEQNDIGRTKIIKSYLEKLKSKNQKCTKDLAKLFFNSITDNLDSVCSIAALIKGTGFEFNSNEIDEVLGEKWKNEKMVIEELFGEEVANRRKNLNLENKASIDVKKSDNNIHLHPESENNNRNNSDTERQNQTANLSEAPKLENANNNQDNSDIKKQNPALNNQISCCVNESKNRKWDIYLCLILSVCIIIFSFIFSFWILSSLSLPIGYLIFRFYKLKKLKDTNDNMKIKSNEIHTGRFEAPKLMIETCVTPKYMDQHNLQYKG